MSRLRSGLASCSSRRTVDLSVRGLVTAGCFAEEEEKRVKVFRGNNNFPSELNFNLTKLILTFLFCEVFVNVLKVDRLRRVKEDNLSCCDTNVIIFC